MHASFAPKAPVSSLASDFDAYVLKQSVSVSASVCA